MIAVITIHCSLLHHQREEPGSSCPQYLYGTIGSGQTCLRVTQSQIGFLAVDHHPRGNNLGDIEYASLPYPRLFKPVWSVMTDWLLTIITYNKSSRIKASCKSTGRWSNTSSLPFPLFFGLKLVAPTREFSGARTKEVSAMNDGSWSMAEYEDNASNLESFKPYYSYDFHGMNEQECRYPRRYHRLVVGFCGQTRLSQWSVQQYYIGAVKAQSKFDPYFRIFLCR